jgi:hypothetical protein
MPVKPWSSAYRYIFVRGRPRTISPENCERKPNLKAGISGFRFDLNTTTVLVNKVLQCIERRSNSLSDRVGYCAKMCDRISGAIPGPFGANFCRLLIDCRDRSTADEAHLAVDI